jgi:hypothetical protein
VCQTAGHTEFNRSIQRFLHTNEHTSRPYHTLQTCHSRLAFPTAVSHFRGDGACHFDLRTRVRRLVCGSFNVISPKQAVPTRICPPLLSQTPGCLSFCLSCYASKGPLLVTRATFTRNDHQNLLNDSLLDDHVQIIGIGVSAVSRKTALLLRKDHSTRSDQPRHFLYQ